MTDTHAPEKNGLPEFLAAFFWEYDPQTLDLERHAEVIIGRLMARGDWAAMRWLRQTYPPARLAAFLATRGRRVLPPRELNYWG